MDKPAHEHLVKEVVNEVEYYPDHPPRKESATFRATKREGHRMGLRCSISGQPNPEYHHLWIEWADADAVDWNVVRDVAIGKVTELPVLDPHTDQPTGETYPVEQSWCWFMTQVTTFFGFDWKAFDPGRPELFVDSLHNMLPLVAKFHRSPTHGIHHRTGPTWQFQGFPRKDGFIFTPDEA